MINTQYAILNTRDEIASTTVESALQISPFMQNKANFRKSQINISTFITKSYEQLTMNNELKNKANSNPIQTQYKANSNPKQTQNKPNTKPIKSNFKGKKRCRTLLNSFGGRFLLTKRAFFYSIGYLETNNYNGLLVKISRKPWFEPVIRLFVFSGLPNRLLWIVTDKPEFCHKLKTGILEKVRCSVKKPLQQS